MTPVPSLEPSAPLKRFIKRATAGWVVALLERAGVVQVDRGPSVPSAVALDRLEVRCQLIEVGDTAPGAVWQRLRGYGTGSFVNDARSLRRRRFNCCLSLALRRSSSWRSRFAWTLM
jgi:hypothetical protein